MKCRWLQPPPATFPLLATSSNVLANVKYRENTIVDLRAKLHEGMLCILFHRDVAHFQLLGFGPTAWTFLYPSHGPHGAFGKGRSNGICLVVNFMWHPDVTVLSNSWSSQLEHIAVNCALFYVPSKGTRQHHLVDRAMFKDSVIDPKEDVTVVTDFKWKNLEEP